MSEAEQSPDPDNYRGRKSESPEESLKSKVGMPNAELEQKAESRKRKAVEKSEVGNPKSEEENNSAPDTYRDDILNSEINKSDPDTYRDEHLNSEIENKSDPDSYRDVNRKSEMEIHHHPEVEKKGFKEYLLEGLMIFIAVMMGFFAESYREHITERAKEKEYIVDIKKDLTADAANLNIWLPSLYNRVLGFDTLISCIETPGPVKNGSDMYYLARLSTRVSIFEPNDNTILEMKSSGSLRLIQNRDIVNGLMDFERSLGQYSNLLDFDSKEDILTYPLLGRLFDAKVFDKMVFIQNKGLTEKEYAGGSRNNTVRPPGNPQLRSYDKEKINLLIYYLHQRKSSIAGEIRRLSVQKELVEKLIKMINKEYNLEDE